METKGLLQSSHLEPSTLNTLNHVAKAGAESSAGSRAPPGLGFRGFRD